MVRRLQEGGELLEGDSRPGWPVCARSNECAEKARAIVVQDRRITTGILAEHRGVGKEAARQILERHLQKTKICSRYVLHCEAVSCLFEVCAAL
jgi:hypothetical protein